MRGEESQRELFQEFSGERKAAERFPSIQKTQKPLLITSSLEQIVFFGIVAILVGCFIFFLGMVRGRSLARQETAMPKELSSPAAALPGPKAALQAPAQPPPPPAQDLTRPYTIQLVTYKKRALAEKEASALRKNGYFSTVLSSGDYYLVCAGQYASSDEAKKDLARFSAKYKDCFLRRK